MASPILWQNEDQTITLIDVPRSIALAQGTARHPCHDHLLSLEPLQAPFPSNEPKSASAKAKLKSNTVDQELHAQYAVLLERALTEVRQYHAGSWCSPRDYVETARPARKKRKLSDGSEEREKAQDDENPPATATADASEEMAAYCLAKLARQDMTTKAARMALENQGSPDKAQGGPGGAHSTDHGLISNTGQAPCSMKLTDSEGDFAYHFRLPPLSSFYPADCHESRSFHHAIRAQAEEQEIRKHFDLILLDPPWPNRSVKRTHKTSGSTYRTPSTLSDIQELLLGIDLDMLMADDCLVAAWVTNKPAVRDLVLGDNGIFATWGVELVEEWIWLKTTVHGEPVTGLDALWRKPYEVLLLGRKRRQTFQLPTQTMAEVKRRVIISVPDLHSRKPCLRELLEPMMRDRNDYRALEVFARHLVAGWWSWGDECIKFNWQGYWKGRSTPGAT